MSKITVTDIDRRVIRVFLSSTFADLDSERNYLARHVFPRLRQSLLKYNITLMDIDLRWGITEEEAKTGKTVKLCLDQIESTKPFFIGILGNRYGWIPESRYLEGLPLTDNDKGKSVTEIEMRHGALDLPEKSNAAFFLKKTDQDYGEGDEARKKLTDLKNAISSSPYPSHFFETDEELGTLIEQTVMSWVKKYYDLDTLSREQYVSAVQKQTVEDYLDGFVTCGKYEAFIDSFAAQCTAPQGLHKMPLIGVAGAGKRAAAAYFSKRLKEKGVVSNIVQYYFEDDCDKQGIEDAVNYLTASIEAQFGPLQTDSYSYKYALPDVLNRLLRYVTAVPDDKPWVLSLGGVHLLPKEDFESWVKFVSLVPRPVIVFFTSGHRSDNRPIVEKYFGEKMYAPGALIFSDEERAELIRSYFRPYGKTINEEYISSIVKSKRGPTGYNVYRNMGNLHIMLNELRIFGEFEHVGDYVSELVREADEEYPFLTVMIRNWSKAYDHNGNRMVETVLALLCKLKYGLDENDILDYLKAPVANWQQFLAVIEPFVYMSDGRYYMHKLYRSSFSVVFTDQAKPIRYDWIEYVEKKVAEKSYNPDYKILELADLYRSEHINHVRYRDEGKPSYYVPECFTPEARYTHEGLHKKLYDLACNMRWVSWILKHEGKTELKKIFGYLEKYGRKVSVFMDLIEGEPNPIIKGLKLTILAMQYEAAGYNQYAVQAYQRADLESMPAPERLQAFYTMSRLSYESGNRKDTVDYATKALKLSVHEKDVKLNRIQQTELMAMMLSVLPIEQVSKDKVIDLIEGLGDASSENQKAMELLLDLLHKIFTGDNESVHQVCEIRVMMYEAIGLRDEMRCKMARAYYQRACVLMDLEKKEESFADFYTAYEIYDSVKNKDDVFISDLAYTSYALTTLSLDLQIGIDYWHILQSGANSMSLLLYYRRGWGELSWLMEEILGYMETVTSLPDWSSHRKMYEDYKEEYENYKKRS